MNKYAVIGIILGTVIIIGGLIWVGKSTINPNDLSTDLSNQSGSSLMAQELNFDFGTISMSNGKVGHEFTVTNSSNQPINIRKIYTSCMCTSVNFKFNQKKYGLFGMEGMGGLTSANITMNPGESGIVEAIYDPNAHGPAGVGPVDRFIYIEDKNGSQLQLEIKAVVTP